MLTQIEKENLLEQRFWIFKNNTGKIRLIFKGSEKQAVMAIDLAESVAGETLNYEQMPARITSAQRRQLRKASFIKSMM